VNLASEYRLGPPYPGFLDKGGFCSYLTRSKRHRSVVSRLICGERTAEGMDSASRTHNFRIQSLPYRNNMSLDGTGQVSDMPSYDKLAEEISNISGVMSSTIISRRGEILGRFLGEIPHSKNISDRAGTIGGTVWGALSVLEPEAGPLTSVVISYNTFRIVGVPSYEKGAAVLATVSVFIDTNELVERIASKLQSLKSTPAQPQGLGSIDVPV